MKKRTDAEPAAQDAPATRTCAKVSCTKPAREGSRYCSYEHNLISARQAGVR
jgi:hypothetical protein